MCAKLIDQSIAGMKSFRLHACREDGSLEAQMVELTWDSITRSESDEESMSFCFQYNRPDKPARWVKVYTPYVTIKQSTIIPIDLLII